MAAPAKGKPAPHGEAKDTNIFGITLPIVFGVAFIMVIILGLKGPFEPTYLNPGFFFTKIQSILSSIITYRLGVEIKIFVGVISAFLIGLNFYLFLRIREYEDEHADHVFAHAEDDERPTGMFGHVINEATDLVKDTHGGVRSTVNLIGGTTENLFNRVMFGEDDADFFEPESKPKVPPRKNIVPEQVMAQTVENEGSVEVEQPNNVAQPVVTSKSTSTRAEDREGAYKWRMIQKIMKSQNPSDWKLAIIEADTLLDMLVERTGFPGATLGERLRNGDPGVFRSLKYAREAHGVRNRIAHEGIEFKLNERDARRTIQLYEEVFREFEYI